MCTVDLESTFARCAAEFDTHEFSTLQANALMKVVLDQSCTQPISLHLPDHHRFSPLQLSKLVQLLPVAPERLTSIESTFIPRRAHSWFDVLRLLLGVTIQLRFLALSACLYTSLALVLVYYFVYDSSHRTHAISGYEMWTPFLAWALVSIVAVSSPQSTASGCNRLFFHAQTPLARLVAAELAVSESFDPPVLEYLSPSTTTANASLCDLVLDANLKPNWLKYARAAAILVAMVRGVIPVLVRLGLPEPRESLSDALVLSSCAMCVVLYSAFGLLAVEAVTHLVAMTSQSNRLLALTSDLELEPHTRCRLLLHHESSFEYWFLLRQYIISQFDLGSQILIAVSAVALISLGLVFAVLIFLYQQRLTLTLLLMIVDASSLILVLAALLISAALCNDLVKDRTIRRISELGAMLIKIQYRSHRKFVAQLKSTLDTLRIDPALQVGGISITQSLLIQLSSILIPVGASLVSKLFV